MLLLMLALLALSQVGCTRTVYAPQTRTEYVERERVDSIVRHDSIFIMERTKGDTIYLTRDRWRTEYRDRLRIDTIIRTDSISYPVEVVRTEYRVPKAVSFMAAVGIAAVIFGVLLLIYTFRR